MKQAHRGTPEHHKKQKEGTKTPPAAHAPPTESFVHINTHRVNPPPSPQRVLQPPPHPHPTPRYRVTHPPSLVAPTPETAQLPFHTEPQQYPVGDPPPQTTQPEATTMEAHQSTPGDTDDHMGQENPATDRGRRFDPHPPQRGHAHQIPPDIWNQLSDNQRRHYKNRRTKSLRD